MLTRIVFGFICFISTGALSQQLLFSNMNNIALASQECYNVTQDKQGYIWFGTERGLYRYANGSLTVFDHRNGLPEESVYAVTEDETGRMWFATSKNRILYFDGKQLREPPFSKAFKKIGDENGIFSIPFFMESDHNGNLYVSNCGVFFSAKINVRTNKVERLNFSLKGTDFMFRKVKSCRMIPFQWNHATFDRPLTITLAYPEKTKVIRVTELNRTPQYIGRTTSCIVKGVDFFSIENHLFRVNADGTLRRTDLPAHILSLHPDNKGGLWVGTLKKGLYYFPDINNMKPEHSSLDGYSVTGIVRDDEDGIWCTTLERGIFYCRNSSVISYRAIKGLNQKTSLLKPYLNSVFVSSEANMLFNIDKDNIRTYPLPGASSTVRCEFLDIVRLNNHWLVSGNMNMFELDDHFHNTGKKYYDFKERGREATAYQVIIMGSRRFLGRQDHISEMLGQMEVVPRLKFTSKMRSILVLNDNTLLAGGTSGLCKFNTKDFRPEKIEAVGTDVVKVMRDHTGRIWVLTRNDGIYWLDGKLRAKKCTLKLPTRIFFDIAEDVNGVVWIGCNRGLLRLARKGASFETQLYNKVHGLPSNEVYKVAATNDHCYFSTFEGLFRVPLSGQMINAVAPPIYLRKATANERSLPTGRKIELTHDRNSLRFVFDVLTFKNTPSLAYYLEYDGEKQPVKRVRTGEILLDNLSAGDYKLAVFGMNADGVTSLHPVVISFEITPPFWRTWTFILTLGLLICCMILLVVRMAIRSNKRKEEAKTAVNKLLAEYQMSALQSQMNPHFIFNAINTIQGYILKKSEKEAYDYLAKFSKLIRMVLHHSQEKQLLLHYDLEALELYLKLEQLRFSNNFDYQINLDSQIDAKTVSIPGMLLQPYVENAVWHGIMNLKNQRRGLISITIRQQGDTFKIDIEDNGVGRAVAATFKKDQHHRSIGMKLTERRIMALNQLEGYETAKVEIIDLFDAKGAPAGTRVELILPII